MADGSAMVCAIKRDIITEMVTAFVTIELRGEITRGQMIQVNTGWRDFLPNEGKEVQIVLKYDHEVMKDMLMQTLA